MVVVFNYAGDASVAVDLSERPLRRRPLRDSDARDFYGPVVKDGVHDGAPLALPMTGLTTAAPAGWPAPAANSEFNVFVVLRTVSGRAPVVLDSRPRPSPRQRPSPP